jgi:REP element-mobilizing transposase RayT
MLQKLRVFRNYRGTFFLILYHRSHINPNMRIGQISFLQKQPKAYGGSLLKTRKGRSSGRPLDTKNTMHLILKSSKAVGEWSFRKSQNEKAIKVIIAKFAHRFGIKILSLANVGNHLHLQIKLSNRYTYTPFIRAITGAIAMAVTGKSKWDAASINANISNGSSTKMRLKFWDYRPYSRVIKSYRAYLNLKDYIQINQIEGYGYKKNHARFIFGMNELKFRNSS